MRAHINKITFISLLGVLLMLGCQNSDTRLQAQSTDSSEEQALVTLTEYSDYQCPACAYFHPIVEKLKEDYGNKLKVIYNDYPLNNHQFAMLAARAAESARNQGKFKEMHDMLFQNQRQWSSSGNPQPIFVNYAKKIGLDVNTFKADLNAADTQKAVLDEKGQGMDRGVDSTPTFYINGEKMVNLPRTYKQFKAQVDIYMEEARQTAHSGN
jgi:protein-disulfide isomerase